MPATPDLPTWQILPAGGGQFLWAATAFNPTRPEESLGTLAPKGENLVPSRLPSMADLFIHATSVLLDAPRGDRGPGAVPMFRTGSGRAVSLSESSICKARSVLEGGSTASRGPLPVLEDSGEDACFPMFRSGSGKSVSVRQSSMRKAAAILEGDFAEKGITPIPEGASCCSGFPMFLTGSGKSVKVSESSIRKAAAVLEEEITGKEPLKPPQRDSDYDAPFFHTGTGNSGLLKQSLVMKASSVLHDVESTETANSIQPPIKFHTAGGRSILISSDALQRAKNLLGDSELGVLCTDAEVEQPLPFALEKRSEEASWNKENIPFVCQNARRSRNGSSILPHGRSFSNPKLPASLCVDRLRMIPECRPLGGPLVEVSNIIGAEHVDMCLPTSEKKRPGRRSSVSPFKKPRISRFTTPLNSNICLLATGPSVQSTKENICYRTRIFSRYPFMLKRKAIRDFFGRAPSHHGLLVNLLDNVKHMNADNAALYIFLDASGFDGIGPGNFQNMLLQAGASLQHTTKEWVTNHYKWILWKLASFERSYPAQTSGKYLTVANVLEELKYRYEREFNYGHRSALKKILDGDASPASMMILCVSAIRAYSKLNSVEMNDTIDKRHSISTAVESNHTAKIELTDGWYSVDAFLDASLSKQLVAGKLFIGQKLRIWGAGLFGWVGPISPLEASGTVSLMMHINGTYRSHWADPLGFCKGPGAPLAFRCIKSSGGKVPRTLVGVTRIYPILYKERFSDGSSVVRSDGMEKKALQLYNQRRSTIAEDIMSDQRDTSVNVTDNDEGAKIFKILENAAEPEMLMADMSSEQLISFSTFQAKQEATRQSGMKKKIEKAFVDAGLDSREVSPFLRVRVVGLTSKGSCRKGRMRGGLITIWNPTEEQINDLVEGKIYVASGLMPLNFSTDTLYLQARGSSTVWKSFPSTEAEKFEPFFTPRTSIKLSNLGGVPLASEFDLATLIVHVGNVYISDRQKKQWIFTTDGSGCSSKLQFVEPYDCLLAVSFCSPVIDNDTSPIISPFLSGATVGFCNLVKRARDQMNHLWVAEATENSTYTVGYKLPYGSHLKEAADSTLKWAKESCLVIQMLRERALCIIGSDGG